MTRVSTAYLLTCAAIGVTGGIVLVGANWLSTLLVATVPWASGAIAGLWLMPATIALRLLQRPLAGILTGLISGLVTFPFSGYGPVSVVTNVWWAFFAEIGFLVVAYRFWTLWQHYAGALLVGIVYPLLSAAYFNLGAMPGPVQIAFVALTVASCSGGVGLGVLVAGRLRAAGVGRLARRRPSVDRSGGSPV